MAPKGISKKLLLNQVHPPPEQTPKFPLHLFEVVEAVLRIWREYNEHIDIAVRPEVLAQNRPEERELRDLPAAAELRDPFALERYPRAHGSSSSHRRTAFDWSGWTTEDGVKTIS